MVSRKICVVTGSRAEYGLLRWVMEGIRNAPDLTLQVIATGMHLSERFGSTYREIEQDGFTIDRKVDMGLESDDSADVTRAMGRGTIGFADALAVLRPDLVLVLGDRFEILSAVSAALIARIPVAHLHGGELTEGAFDDAIRHAVTKMSHLHFVAAPPYRDRVIQLGEAANRVYVVGALGIDAIERLKPMSREELEARLDFSLGDRTLLVAFHPATLDSGSPEQQIDALLGALGDLADTRLFFTLPNADPGSRVICQRIEAFVKAHANARAYASLGQRAYLSCMRLVAGVVGNSSSGIIEAPALRVGTVNIGKRQQGRLMAGSIINCAPERAEISAALKRLYSPAFRECLQTVHSLYGAGGASTKVVEVIRTAPLEGLLNKVFVDQAAQTAMKAS